MANDDLVEGRRLDQYFLELREEFVRGLINLGNTEN